jgi:hypothetical protein
MKVLVLSNVPGGVDDIVSLLEGQHSVTAKEAASAPQELAEAAAAQLASGSYAMVVVVAKDPVAVSIALNKKEGVVAAVCNTAEEAQLARRNAANAVVVKEMERGQLDEILSIAISGSGVFKRIGDMARQQPKAQERLSVKPVPDQKAQKAFAQGGQAKRQEREQQGEAQMPQKPRSGVVGKLKDYLGIV